MSESGGLLDLAEVEQAPTKVRVPAAAWPRGVRWLRRLAWWLPDSRLYDMADPKGLGALSLQRLVSRYKRAEQLAAAEEPSDADLAELLELLLDVCQVVLPGASRPELAALGFNRQQRLIEAFFQASPAAGRKQRRGAKKAQTSVSS